MNKAVRGLVLTFAIVAGLVFAPGAVLSAGAANTASVSGKVTAEVGGANLQGVLVSVMPEFGPAVGSATTNASGTYSITGLPAGTYTILFDTLGAINYLSEWYSGQTSQANADYFDLAEGQAATSRNATLIVGATISGNVKGAPSTNLQNVAVTVIDAFGQVVRQATTNSAGNYSVFGLAAGDYTLGFATDLNYIDEYYNDKQFSYEADYFSITTGSTSGGRDAVLAAGASISGRVSTTVGNSSVQNSTITFYSSAGDLVGSVATDASGNYTINGLYGGQYTAVFGQGSGSYAVEWWENKPTLSTATFITVATGGAATGKDVQLDAAATITGTVQTETGQPFAGAAYLYLANGGGANLSTFMTATTMAGDGSYSFGGLPIGAYVVGFTADASAVPVDGSLPGSGDYISQWFSNQYSYATGTLVQIVAAGSTIVADAVIAHPEFADVSDPTSPFFASIQWMFNAGISQGTAQAGAKPLYNPGNTVSRQAMASFLLKLSGQSYTPPAVASFADVPVGSTFYTAIEWMKFKGISTGTPQASGLPLFKPADSVSRQAMALFLARYAGVNVSVAPTEQSFADVPTSASAAAAIKWMRDTGISTGTAQPSGLPLYKPADAVSRQAMAAFLFRLAHLA